MNSPENYNKGSDDNIQDIIPDTQHTYLLEDHQFMRNALFDSIAHWFSTNACIRFMCAFQIGFLLQILRKKNTYLMVNKIHSTFHLLQAILEKNY